MNDLQMLTGQPFHVQRQKLEAVVFFLLKEMRFKKKKLKCLKVKCYQMVPNVLRPSL